MCGIAGIIHRNKAGRIGSEMTMMLQAMKHRGPDSTGFAVYGPPAAGVLAMRFKAAEKEDLHALAPTTVVIQAVHDVADLQGLRRDGDPCLLAGLTDHCCRRRLAAFDVPGDDTVVSILPAGVEPPQHQETVVIHQQQVHRENEPKPVAAFLHLRMDQRFAGLRMAPSAISKPASSNTCLRVPSRSHPSRNVATASCSDSLASSGLSPKLDTFSSRHRPT